MRQCACLPTSSWAWLAMLLPHGWHAKPRRWYAVRPGAPSRADHGRPSECASRVMGEERGWGD